MTLPDQKVPLDDQKKAEPTDPEKASSSSTNLCHSPGSSCSLFWRHVKALEIKRFHHSKRNKKGILCEVGKGTIG